VLAAASLWTAVLVPDCPLLLRFLDFLAGVLGAVMEAVVKITFIIAHTRNNVVVLLGTLKVRSFMLTEVKDCDLLIVVTSSTFLKRKDMLKEKSS